MSLGAFASRSIVALLALSVMVSAPSFAAPSAGEPVKNEAARSKADSDVTYHKLDVTDDTEGQSGGVLKAKDADSDGATATESAEQPASEQTADESGTGDEQAQAVAVQDGTEHYYMGAHYLSNWDLDLAEVELEQAIKYVPDMRIAHRDLCIVSLMKLNPLRCIAEFMMVTGLGEPIPYTDKEKQELNDKALIAHYKRALVWGKQMKWREAATELEWALTYRPDDFAVHRSLAFVYANMGDYEKAEEQYKTTFELAPKDGFAHADLANFLQDRGQLEHAQKELENAVALQPKAAALHVDLGWIAETRGDLKIASKEFKTAVTLSPEHAELWKHLGKVLEQTGESPQAVAAYTECLRLSPNQPDVKDSLARMKQKLSASYGHNGT